MTRISSSARRAQDAAGERPQALARLEVVDERDGPERRAARRASPARARSGSTGRPCSRSSDAHEVLQRRPSCTSPSWTANVSSSQSGASLADVVAELGEQLGCAHAPRSRLVVDGHAERRRQRRGARRAVRATRRAASANDCARRGRAVAVAGLVAGDRVERDRGVEHRARERRRRRACRPRCRRSPGRSRRARGSA